MAQKYVDFELSDADLTLIKDNIHEITAKLPFLVAMVIGEKRKKLKLGDKGWSFITDAYNSAKLNSSLYPPDMKLIDFKRDYLLLIKLRQIQKMINVLAGSVNDTVFELEAECTDSGLAFYNSIQKAAKRNNPDAAVINESLKKYFAKKPYVKKNLKKTVKRK